MNRQLLIFYNVVWCLSFKLLCTYNLCYGSTNQRWTGNIMIFLIVNFSSQFRIESWRMVVYGRYSLFLWLVCFHTVLQIVFEVVASLCTFSISGPAVQQRWHQYKTFISGFWYRRSSDLQTGKRRKLLVRLYFLVGHFPLTIANRSEVSLLVYISSVVLSKFTMRFKKKNQSDLRTPKYDSKDVIRKYGFLLGKEPLLDLGERQLYAA